MMMMNPGEAVHEAEDVHAMVLNASSDADIIVLCDAVENFLRRHSKEQTRHFYTVCFPVLLSRIFGFDDPCCNGWISHPPNVSQSVVRLLSPQGVLLASMVDADSANIVHYVFPIERLPYWIRSMLLLDKGSSFLVELFPVLFKGRLKEEQLQLNVFEYFIFWFAYYAVCHDKNDAMVYEDVNNVKFMARRGSSSYFDKWTHRAHQKGNTHRSDDKPYLFLVDLYLKKFLPVWNSHAGDANILSRGEFVFHTFVQFWCVNNDPLPLPLHFFQSLGISLPSENNYGSFVQASVHHIDAIHELLCHVNSGFCIYTEDQNSSSLGSNSLSIKASTSFARNMDELNTLSAVLQRPIYRFILRSLIFWPVGTSVKEAVNVVDLWLDYLQPWMIRIENLSKDGFQLVETEKKMSRDPSKVFQISHNVMRKRRGMDDLAPKDDMEMHQSRCFTDKWQFFVLANFPFYNRLFVHFLSFAHKFLHIDAHAVLLMTHKVLNFFASSDELRTFLQRVELAFNNVKTRTLINSVDNLQKALPTIRDELQDWEGDLISYGKDSNNSSQELGDSSLHFFSSDKSAGYQILKMLVLRGEAWIHSDSGEMMIANMQLVEDIKALISVIFGTWDSDTASPPSSSCDDTRSYMKQPGLRRHTWADVKYKGDWMKRPIGDTEIAWLARVLVKVSDYLNYVLGLSFDGAASSLNESEDSHTKITFAEIRENNDISVFAYLSDWNNWKNILMLISLFVWHCCLNFLFQTQKLFRKRGWRINLRYLAEKRTLLCIFLCIFFIQVKKSLMLYF